MSDQAPLPNSPEARTETGEIKPPTALGTEPPVDPSKAGDSPVNPAKSPTLLNGDPPKDGAPEAYTEFKLPEGFTLNGEVTKEASELFKGLNLPQEGAQKLVDFYAAKLQSAVDAPHKLWRETQDKWTSEIKADPEIGGKLDQVKLTVGRAIDSLGDAKLASDFRQAMDYTGAGNNPAFVRAFYKLAQKVTEGSHVAGKGPVEVKNPTGQPPSAAKAMYPNLP